MSRVCPWWLGYALLFPPRKLVQDPGAILRPFVGEGMTALEVGPGMGFFTLDLARLVGPSGKVVCVDIERRMLDRLGRRAAAAGLDSRIECRLAARDRLPIEDLQGRADFCLAFAVVHELPDPDAFFRQSFAALKPGGKALLAEPRLHVGAGDFAASAASARRAGFDLAQGPRIWMSRAVTLVKPPATPRPAPSRRASG